jgi:hypothetical protein
MQPLLFPLYDTIYDTLEPSMLLSDITLLEKTFVMKQIKKYDPTIHERIYALIRYHQLKNSNDTSQIPYEGKIFRNNVIFDIDKLPIILKRIIHRFCKVNDASNNLKESS